MLFNSLAFIFVFLPASLLLVHLAGRRSARHATLALVAASFFFYGWWDPTYLLLLAGSILWNWAIGRSLAARASRPLLALGIAGDLAVLAAFKYADFALGTAAALTGLELPVLGIVLPIGISFFTFTQIAFLVDAARGEAREIDLPRYALFVTFYPHLLAGPLLHHKEMMPQFARGAAPLAATDLSVGLTIFVIGLAKKVVLADGIAPFAAPVFAAVETGGRPDLLQAWGAALAYSFQLYFDFSGYSDMAIGAARCFGILMPLNFDSPYKATNISEFWRRWHMTLSRFLRDYLYVPLGGNRKGQARRYVNLMLTMLLGGLWHGAAWTFVAWGALHGLFLCLHHASLALRRRLGIPKGALGRPGAIAATALTFAAVTVAWVFFRAQSFSGALAMLAGMAGQHGNAGPESLLGVSYGAALYGGIDETLMLAALAAVAFLAPSTQQLLAGRDPALPARDAGLPGPHLVRWTPRPVWALAVAALLVIALSRMSGISPFLYYQF